MTLWNLFAAFISPGLRQAPVHYQTSYTFFNHIPPRFKNFYPYNNVSHVYARGDDFGRGEIALAPAETLLQKGSSHAVTIAHVDQSPLI